jgi:cytochrome P450 family 4
LISEIFSNVIDRGIGFEKVIKVWIGPKLIVFLIDPNDVEVILSSHVHIDKAPEYRLFEPWLGNGLLISTGKFLQKKNKIKSVNGALEPN